MKYNKRNLAAVLLLALSVVTFAPNTFAADNIILNYSGGEDLGEANVTQDANLVNNLEPLVSSSNRKAPTFSSGWLDGYIIANSKCSAVKYFKIASDTNLDYSYTIPSDTYQATISIKRAALKDLNLGEDEAVAVMVLKGSGGLHARHKVYATEECSNDALAPGVKGLSTKSGGFLFLEVEANIYEKGKTEKFTSNELYYGFLDIDVGQSFKILNSGNEFQKSNTFTLDLTKLQPTDTALRNKYVPDGKYIYSEISENGDYIQLLDGGGNVYTKIKPEVQLEGLRFVAGFGGAAGSSFSYFAKMYKVQYESDEHGKIVGVKNEDIVSGKNPFGSSQESDPNYELDYWMANVDVDLIDGTLIKAGDPITMDQIKQIEVNKDIKFTAVHRVKEKAPNTGAFTGENNGMAGIVGLSLAIGAPAVALGYYAYNRKKHNVKFN